MQQENFIGALSTMLSGCANTSKIPMEARHGVRRDSQGTGKCRHIKSKLKALQLIQFAKQGQRVTSSGKFQTEILSITNDLQMQVDLKRRLIFPPEVCTTTLRPDIVICSCRIKQIVMIEVIEPWENCAEVRNERRQTKYDELKKDFEESGYNVWCLPNEICCRGLMCPSVLTMCKTLRLQGKDRKDFRVVYENTAKRISSWLWMRRNDHIWGVIRLSYCLAQMRKVNIKCMLLLQRTVVAPPCRLFRSIKGKINQSHGISLMIQGEVSTVTSTFSTVSRLLPYGLTHTSFNTVSDEIIFFELACTTTIHAFTKMNPGAPFLSEYGIPNYTDTDVFNNFGCPVTLKR